MQSRTTVADLQSEIASKVNEYSEKMGQAGAWFEPNFCFFF